MPKYLLCVISCFDDPGDLTIPIIGKTCPDLSGSSGSLKEGGNSQIKTLGMG